MKTLYLKRIAFGLLTAVLLIFITAACAGKLQGSECALDSIYRTWWFAGLWSVWIIVSFVYLIWQRQYKHLPTFVFHCGLGIVLIGLFISFLSVESGGDDLLYAPYGRVVTYIAYFLLAVLILWILWLRTGWKGIVWLFVPVICIWMYALLSIPIMPVLQTPAYALHVSVVIASCLLLLYIAVTGIIGIVSKKRRVQLQRRNRKLLYTALFGLVASIFTGSLWISISYDWYVVETWALIALFVYAFPFHRRSLPLFANPLKFHIYCLSAFLFVSAGFLWMAF